jgi:hypothetical protein
MGPGTVLDAVVKRKIPPPAGNRTLKPIEVMFHTYSELRHLMQMNYHLVASFEAFTALTFSSRGLLGFNTV